MSFSVIVRGVRCPAADRMALWVCTVYVAPIDERSVAYHASPLQPRDDCPTIESVSETAGLENDALRATRECCSFVNPPAVAVWLGEDFTYQLLRRAQR